MLRKGKGRKNGYMLDDKSTIEYKTQELRLKRLKCTNTTGTIKIKPITNNKIFKSNLFLFEFSFFSFILTFESIERIKLLIRLTINGDGS